MVIFSFIWEPGLDEFLINSPIYLAVDIALSTLGEYFFIIDEQFIKMTDTWECEKQQQIIVIL